MHTGYGVARPVNWACRQPIDVLATSPVRSGRRLATDGLADAETGHPEPVEVATVRAGAYRYVWSLLPDGVPASKVAGTDLDDSIVVDIDATTVVTH